MNNPNSTPGSVDPAGRTEPAIPAASYNTDHPGEFRHHDMDAAGQVKLPTKEQYKNSRFSRAFKLSLQFRLSEALDAIINDG